MSLCVTNRFSKMNPFKETPFSELKDYFEKTDLPKSVGVSWFICYDVKKTASNEIKLIECMIESKIDLKRSAVALASKQLLYNLRTLCLDESTHGKVEFDKHFKMKNHGNK